MAVIVNLRDIVPADIEVQALDGQTYYIAGDLDTDTLFEMLAIWQEAQEAELGADATDVTIRAHAKRAELFLLDVLKQRHPDLEKCPFGHVGMRHVFLVVLSTVGLVLIGADPENPAGEADPTAGKPKQSRSPRSAGSSASRKRS